MSEELKEKIKRLEETYAEELKRKDKIIDELKEENTVVMKSALNQSKKIDELTKKLKDALKKQK
jgi:hypothetical protein